MRIKIPRLYIIAVLLLLSVSTGFVFLLSATNTRAAKLEAVEVAYIEPQTNTPWSYSPPAPENTETRGITTKTRVEKTPSHAISAFYPETESEPVNESVNAFIENEIQAFKNRYPNGFLDIHFSGYSYNEYILGFAFDIYRRNSASGSEIVKKTFVYDLMGACEVELRQLFEHDYDFLSVLSEYADGLQNGGTYEEFSSFVFDESNLYVFLPSDEPAPGGFKELKIPVSAFGDGWNADGYFASYFYKETDDDTSAHKITVAETGGLTGDVDFPEVLLPADASAPPEGLFAEVLTGGQPENLSAVPDNKKYIALTFDDGPHRDYTTRLLDALKQHNAKATFFVLGHRLASMTDIITRMHEEGHSVGNHTYNHKQLTTLSRASITSQITDTNDAIRQITGQETVLLRPPYGSRNNTVASVSAELGMSIILWNIDPLDWEDLNAERIASHVISRVKDGDIILMHDMYKTTIDAAEIILEKLTELDFVFVTVEELINMNSGLTVGSAYKNGKGPSK